MTDSLPISAAAHHRVLTPTPARCTPPPRCRHITAKAVLLLCLLSLIPRSQMKCFTGSPPPTYSPTPPSFSLPQIVIALLNWNMQEHFNARQHRAEMPPPLSPPITKRSVLSVSLSALWMCCVSARAARRELLFSLIRDSEAIDGRAARQKASEPVSKNGKRKKKHKATLKAKTNIKGRRRISTR